MYASWVLIDALHPPIGIYILLNPIYKFEVLSLFLGLIAVTLGWTFFLIPWWSIGIAISENSSKVRFKRSWKRIF